MSQSQEDMSALSEFFQKLFDNTEEALANPPRIVRNYYEKVSKFLADAAVKEPERFTGLFHHMIDIATDYSADDDRVWLASKLAPIDALIVPAVEGNFPLETLITLLHHAVIVNAQSLERGRDEGDIWLLGLGKLGTYPIERTFDILASMIDVELVLDHSVSCRVATSILQLEGLSTDYDKYWMTKNDDITLAKVILTDHGLKSTDPATRTKALTLFERCGGEEFVLNVANLPQTLERTGATHDFSSSLIDAVISAAREESSKVVAIEETPLATAYQKEAHRRVVVKAEAISAREKALRDYEKHLLTITVQSVQRSFGVASLTDEERAASASNLTHGVENDGRVDLMARTRSSDLIKIGTVSQPMFGIRLGPGLKFTLDMSQSFSVVSLLIPASAARSAKNVPAIDSDIVVPGTIAELTIHRHFRGANPAKAMLAMIDAYLNVGIRVQDVASSFQELAPTQGHDLQELEAAPLIGKAIIQSMSANDLRIIARRADLTPRTSWLPS